ncbi:MAG: glycosyltransferase, partial [Desulfovibrio sp.]|nr:glycosyltransferase [Desulfovibrio sp.]
NYDSFSATEYPRFARAYLSLAEQGKVPAAPQDYGAYAVWSSLRERAEHGGAQPPATGPGFSLLMPIYGPRPEHLRAALDSVLAQTCGDWELCIADDASPGEETAGIIREYMARDRRIRAVFREENGRIAKASNSALALATKPWALLMDQDDLLAPEALEVMARAMEAAPGGRLFYSDEDKVSDTGARFNPHFKNNAWDWELVAAQNFVCHLAAYRTERLRALGGFREGFEGAQDHDLVLRYVTGLEGRELIHVPRVLYHWRAHAGSTAMHLGAKGYALESARAAVRDWLAASSPGSVPDEAPVVQWVRVRHALPAARPLVSLLCQVPGPDFDLAGHARALARETAWPHESIYLCAAEDQKILEGRLAALEADGARARLCAVPA